MRRLWALALPLEFACASNTAHLDVGVVPLNVSVESRIEYYDVTAANLAELRRGLREQGPRWEGRRWDAVTQAQYRWTYQLRSGGTGCRLSDARVYVRTIVTFPRWNASAAPDSATLAWWEQFNAGLVEHERGHALIAVA